MKSKKIPVLRITLIVLLILYIIYVMHFNLLLCYEHNHYCKISDHCFNITEKIVRTNWITSIPACLVWLWLARLMSLPYKFSVATIFFLVPAIYHVLFRYFNLKILSSYVAVDELNLVFFKAILIIITLATLVALYLWIRRWVRRYRGN